MKATIPTPTLRGMPEPELEVRIRFERGKGWLPVISDGHEERGRGKHSPTFLAAARLIAESLEAAK